MNSNFKLIENEKNQITIEFFNSLSIKLKDFSIENLIDLINSKSDIDGILYNLNGKKVLLSDFFGKFLGIIFIEPIKIKYKNILYNNKYVTLIDEKVYSSLQIDCINDYLNIKKANVFYLKNEQSYYFDYFLNKKHLLFLY
jgi:hypothetical protein